MYKTITIAVALALIAVVGFFNYDAYTISLNATTSNVTPNPSTISLGAPITFHVKVVDTSTTKIIATGSVSWSDGGAGGVFGSSGSCTLAPISGSTSSATCSIAYTAPYNTSPVTITATYSGDSTHTGSSGTSALTLTLRSAKTSVSPNPAGIAIGVPITFRAKIADTSAGTKTVPAYIVSWSDGGKGGSFNSASCTLAQYGTSTSTSTCVTVYTPPSSTGPVTITATYSGDSTHAVSSGTSALTVNLRATKDTILLSASSPTIGLVINFQAKIFDSSGGTKSMPTGTVTWSDGGAGGSFTSLEGSNSCTLAQYGTSTSTSICSVGYFTPNAGPVTITGTYSGDGIHSTSSEKLTLTVNLRAAKTTILPNPATAVIGVPMTFNAKILDSSIGTKSIPAGTVSWSDGGAGGSFDTTSCTLSQYGTSTSTSICAVIYTPAATGPVTITGTYLGDSLHTASSGTSALTVGLRTSSTGVTPNPATNTLGASIFFKALITDTSSGTAIPTGTASWSDGGAGGTFDTTSCTLAPAASDKSQCTVMYTSASLGLITITANYSGDGAHDISSGTSTLTVS